MDNHLFRKAALDKLSSPEKLDQLMHVTTPRSWLALVACSALVFTALLWSIFGRIHTTVSGPGILIRHGGIFVATARGNGNISKILVDPGSFVHKGDRLAMVDQPELQLKKLQGAVTVEHLAKEMEELQKYNNKQRTSELESALAEKKTYQAMTNDYEVQIVALKNRLAKQEQAVNVVTPVMLFETKNQLFQAQHDLARAHIQLMQVDQNLYESDERRRQHLEELQLRKLQAEQELKLTEDLLRLNSEITSPFAGFVLEMMVKEGQLVNAGAPIMSLQDGAQPLEARVFLSPADGKRVLQSMDAAVSPASVKKEVFGSVVGTVLHVSEFPTTPQGMLAILENPGLVTEFTQAGMPIEVRVQLHVDPRDPRRFHWTSKKGGYLPLSSGTLCTAEITISTNRPIELALPMFKKSSF